MRRAFAIVLIIACLLLTQPYAPAKAEGEAELTLMVYMCGSNLESRHAAASADLMEMASSGYDVRRVNLLVMTGGTSQWAMNIPADALCVYQPGRGSLRMVQAYEPQSMGDPEALRTLLRLGYERYPAKRYALIFWDHGGGPLEGVCWDELYDSDHLTAGELTSALASSPARETPLEWIGFDACLMGSAEMAALLAPYARYMIASEETEPGDGWDYSFLSTIDRDADGAETGRRVIDGYFAAPADASDRTLALIDLTRLQTLQSTLDALFPKLEITGGNYALYSFAARHTRAFGRGAGDTGSYDLIDLASLIGQLREQSPENADAALAALQACVLYSRGGQSAGGLSVYHPYANKADYVGAWGGSYALLGFSRGYAAYVERFAQYLFGHSGVDWTALAAAATDRPDVYALPLTEQQQAMLSSCTLELLRWDEASGTYAAVCSVDQAALEEGVLYAGWNGQVLIAVDPSGAPATGAIPYEPRPDGSFQVYVNYCKPEALGSAEALRIVQADTTGLKKDYGSYDFDTDETESSSAGSVISGGTAGTADSGIDEQDISQTESSSLSDRVSGELTVTTLAPYTQALEDAVLSVPESVSLSSAAPVHVGTAGSLALMPPVEGARIEPADIESIFSINSIERSVGTLSSQLPEGSLTEIEVTSFDPEQVEIDLSGFELPSPSEEEAPDVVHACLVCALEADGTVSVRETWLYDPEAELWSTRGALDESVWSGAAFPIVWKQPTLLEGALTGFSTWATAGATAEQLPRPGWSFRFAPLPEDAALCVSFQVTDTQNQTYSSEPMVRQG